MILEINRTVRIPSSELTIRFARSGGPGGQNVNKVSTRVDLVFEVTNSPSLSDDQKNTVLAKLRTRIDKSGTLRISSQQSRSQWKNRQIVLERFVLLMRTALAQERKRVPTGRTKASAEKRLRGKKARSANKRLRAKVRSSEE